MIFLGFLAFRINKKILSFGSYKRIIYLRFIALGDLAYRIYFLDKVIWIYDIKRNFLQIGIAIFIMILRYYALRVYYCII